VTLTFASIWYVAKDKPQGTPDKPLPVRLPPELVARIDRLRGMVPRERYVRYLLERAATAEERKAKRR
jgi:hypothetical protein